MDAFAEAVTRPTTRSIIEQALGQGLQQRSYIELNLGAYIGKVDRKSSIASASHERKQS